MPPVQIHGVLGRITNVTFGAAAACIIANIVFAFHLDHLPHWAHETFGTGEQNILTWLSSALLLYCALLLAIHGHAEKQGGSVRWRRWIELSVVFFLLSLDETAELHENLTIVVRESLGLKGYLYFAWVVPGAAFALAIFLRTLGLLRTLPAATRKAMLYSGALYLTGAIGIEAVGANYTSHSGQVQDLTFQLLCTVEEGLEVFGLWWFLRAAIPYSASWEAAVDGDRRDAPSRAPWIRLLAELGRAAALGAAITGAVALVTPHLVKLDSSKLAELIEAEELPRAASRNCQTGLVRIKQEFTTGGISRNTVLKLVPVGPMPEQSFSLNAPRKGKYRLEIHLARHRMFGEVGVVLNGNLLRRIDLAARSDKIMPTGPIDLGTVQLGATNTLTIRLLKARRHYAFDGIRLVPVK